MNAPRMTITEIAQLAGVSKKTVSRYFNHPELLGRETRARLEAVIAETGFVPNAQARSLALRPHLRDAEPGPADQEPAEPASPPHNMLVTLLHDGTDRGVAELATAGIAGALAGTDFALALHLIVAAGATTRLRNFLNRQRPAGVVLLPPLSERDDLAALCTLAGVRCVRLGRVRGGGGAITCDDRGAMARMVSWLIRIGHRRIALVSGPESSLTAQQRELGYLDAMADHGLDRGPSLIVAGDNSFASGISAGRLLLELSPRPSAIIASNDEMAAGVLQAAAQAGITIPADLSVVGFDDSPLAERLVPQLTSMRVPWDQMAAEAVAQILANADLPDALPPFEAELTIRDSVAPLEGAVPARD